MLDVARLGCCRPPAAPLQQSSLAAAGQLGSRRPAQPRIVPGQVASRGGSDSEQSFSQYSEPSPAFTIKTLLLIINRHFNMVSSPEIIIFVLRPKDSQREAATMRSFKDVEIE